MKSRKLRQKFFFSRWRKYSSWIASIVHADRSLTSTVPSSMRSWRAALSTLPHFFGGRSGIAEEGVECFMMVLFLLFSAWRGWWRAGSLADMPALDNLRNRCLLIKSKKERRGALKVQCSKRSTALLVLLATLEFVGNILSPKEVLLLEHWACTAPKGALHTWSEKIGFFWFFYGIVE